MAHFGNYHVCIVVTSFGGQLNDKNGEFLVFVETEDSAEGLIKLFARLGAKQSLGDLSLPIFSRLQFGLKPSDVVEFYGGEGCGKSEVLLNITAHCVLPKLWRGRQLPGRGVEVVYICTDCKFELLRLVTILEGKVHERVGETVVTSEDHTCHEPIRIQCHDDSHKELIKSCLGRVHILHCNSSAELLFALHSLKTFLRNHSEVGALCLDHVGSFYWVDRSECGGARQSSEFRQQLWVSALSELIQERHLVVFAARPLLFMARDRGEGPGSHGSGWDRGASTHEDFMCRAWQRLVKYRFHLQKSQVQQRSEPHPASSEHKTLSVPFAGTFTSQQTHPPGPLCRFVIQEHGLEFIPPL